jgi:hypothetical protein
MLSLSAPKGAKCLCGKRAKSTLMSRDSKRELLPCCVKCGLIGLEFIQRRERDEATSGGALIAPELQKWFTTDSGMSSMTIASVLVPELRQACLARLDYDAGFWPRDPDDFGRCHRLLALIPDGVARLGEVSAAYPKWSRLVAAWRELASLYEEERPNGTAPKLYRRIKELTPND